MARVNAPVEPKTLIWAREKAGYDHASAVSRIPWLRDKQRKGHDAIRVLKEVERGATNITVRQAEEMAKIYNLGVAALYIPSELLAHQPQPQEFTDHRNPDEGPLGPNAIRFLRQAKTMQEWAKEWLAQEEGPELDWVASMKDRQDGTEEQSARFLHEKIWGKPSKSPKADIKEWIKRAEDRLGIFVMQSRVAHQVYNLEENFGSCILVDKLAPVVVLNYQLPEPDRLLELVHGLVRLLIGDAGIFKTRQEQDAIDLDPIAHFCREVTRRTLMPTRHFEEIWKAIAGPEQLSISEYLGIVEQVANRFGTSKNSCLNRAAELRIVPQQTVSTIVAELSAEPQSETQQESPSSGFYRRPHYEALARSGKRLANYILTAYNCEAISAVDVNQLLEMKLKYLPKLAEATGSPLTRWVATDG